MTSVVTSGATTRDLQDLSLLDALHSLQRLTAAEVTIAGIRSFQARDEALKQELRENRRKAQERERLIAAVIADEGGTPTPFSPAMGKAIAFAKAQLDGTATFVSALLGDLAMEAVLLERARFTRRLAQRLGRPEVVRLCDGLEAAHSATITWLRERLDELADTGRSRLRPLPSQVVVGALRKAVLLPVLVASRRGRTGGSPGEAYPQEGTTADVRGVTTTG